MLTILRRTLLLWLFMFWQGGFFFYAAVVVKVGADLNGHFAQGMITREVAIWLNLAGLLTLLAWIWDLLAERKTCRKRRWALWFFMLLALGCLAWLHPHLDELIDSAHDRLVKPAEFRLLHRCYLYISTAQWLASILFTFWTLQNWRAGDGDNSSKG
jgi:hypothetical protein